MNLRVGIVGGAGQVGSALLKTLNNNRGLTAFAICRSKVSAARVITQGQEARITETDNAAKLAEATRDLDVLVNCALPLYTPSKTSAANQRLAHSLITACAGKHLIHLSSVAVYGDFLSGRPRLFDHPKPDTPYGREKLQMERLLRMLAKKYTVKCTILRVGHVYGPEFRWSEAIFDLIKQDGFLLPFGGQLSSNAIGIWNLIAGIRESLCSESKQATATFNLIDNPRTTWRDVFDLHSQASRSPCAETLSSFESERHFRMRKKRAETGTMGRLMSETWRWVRYLPASYMASVPTFKAIGQWAAGRVGSERLDARLWAVYCKRFAPRIEPNASLEIPSVFWSEPVPGPCLKYQGDRPTESFAALQSWHDAISTPLVVRAGSVE